MTTASSPNVFYLITANTTLKFWTVDEARLYTGTWTTTSNAIADGAIIEVIIKDTYGNVTRQQADGRLFINQE